MKKFVLDEFIVGECINLKIPDKNFVKNSNWHKILNSKKNTKYLDHGIFPNTLENQLNFFENSKKDGRIVLIIFDTVEHDLQWILIICDHY